MQRLMALSMAESLFSTELRDVMPFIVGIQMDFSKRPFRAVGLSFEGWGTKFKARMKR